MFLIDAIKLNVEKKFKTCFIFSATVQGIVRIVPNKPSFYLFVLSLLAAKKNIFKKKRERYKLNKTQPGLKV